MKGRTSDCKKNRQMESYSHKEGLKRISDFIENSDFKVRKRDIILNDQLPNERWFIVNYGSYPKFKEQYGAEKFC